MTLSVGLFYSLSNRSLIQLLLIIRLSLKLPSNLKSFTASASVTKNYGFLAGAAPPLLDFGTTIVVVVEPAVFDAELDTPAAELEFLSQ